MEQRGLPDGTGLVARWIARHPPDLDRSFVIGDRDTDLAFADNLGLAGLKLGDGRDGTLTWPQVARRVLGGFRCARLERRTLRGWPPFESGVYNSGSFLKAGMNWLMTSRALFASPRTAKPGPETTGVNAVTPGVRAT